MVLKTRDLFTTQRTQTINALRGHLAEYGVIAPKGPVYLSKLEAALDDTAHDLPNIVIARKPPGALAVTHKFGATN